MPLIVLMSPFFCIKLRTFDKNSAYTPRNSMRAVSQVFKSFFSFCKVKVKNYYYENVSIRNHASGIWLSNCSKLVISWKIINGVTIRQNGVSAKNFQSFYVFLNRVSYWSKFHVNIITSSGVSTVFMYEEFSRNPEIENNLF